MMAIGAILFLVPFALVAWVALGEGQITDDESWSGLVALFLGGVGAGLMLAALWGP